MVRIRLARYGRKNKPSYRIVVIDSKKKRNGKYLEKLGYYNPTEDDKNVVFDKKRYEHWISVGAQPSEAVVKLVKGTYVFKSYEPNAEKQTEESESSDSKGLETPQDSNDEKSTIDEKSE